MALAWIEEQSAEETPEERFSPGAPCRSATWESARTWRSHEWTWAEEPAAVTVPRFTEFNQVRLHHAIADLHRICSELQDLSRVAIGPVLEGSLRRAVVQMRTSLDQIGHADASEGSESYELIDWHSVNREQWSRGMRATVDEDGSEVTLISVAAQLLPAVESDDEEPLLDE
jgi:hypothetical protein